MSYYVKKCRKCGAVNHPNNVRCQQCGEELPIAKIESDDPPPAPSGQQSTPPISARAEPAQARPSIKAEVQSSPSPNGQPSEVRIVDIRMPFLSMVAFMVKWALAAIPALLILIVIGAVLSGFLTGLLRAG